MLDFPPAYCLSLLFTCLLSTVLTATKGHLVYHSPACCPLYTVVESFATNFCQLNTWMGLPTKDSWPVGFLELSMEPSVRSKRCDWQAGDSGKDSWGEEAKSGTRDISKEPCRVDPGDTRFEAGMMTNVKYWNANVRKGLKRYYWYWCLEGLLSVMVTRVSSEL